MEIGIARRSWMGSTMCTAIATIAATGDAQDADTEMVRRGGDSALLRRRDDLALDGLDFRDAGAPGQADDSSTGPPQRRSDSVFTPCALLMASVRFLANSQASACLPGWRSPIGEFDLSQWRRRRHGAVVPVATLIRDRKPCQCEAPRSRAPGRSPYAIQF
ncbi:MAG: hypothetical protein KGL18_03305 [Burkholderiales bacterium]|nr:hypothetical protein [Burkholderiales bacterium]MDE1926561.1 hypothetical protein [Burkholderiales bacterium]MDE2160996.1 hypothetical protein [Burkholderiales bacterium]MDE2501993.1 hypothetical protein [Burkholderiales bacterium]